MLKSYNHSGGGIGRHVALKQQFLLECGFDSHPEYKIREVVKLIKLRNIGKG